MHNSLKSITVVALLIGSLWYVPRVHFVHFAKMCSGPTGWRMTVQPTDGTSFGLAAGIYQISSYSLTNGFGLISVGQSSIAVFKNLNLPAPVSSDIAP